MKKRIAIADVVVCAVCVLLAIITIYPMYYVLIMSISGSEAVLKMDVFLYPKDIQFHSYQVILSKPDMWRSYANTIFYVIVTTLLMVTTSLLISYPLTFKKLVGRKFLVVFLLIPMYFSGGLIPSFLLVNSLGLYNTIWAIILPGAYGIWNIILMRTYLNSISETLREAAKIDGANNFQILFQIYRPLAKPIIAVIAIYTVVGVWNSWFNALVYLTEIDLQPLQLYLRRVLIEVTQRLDVAVTAEEARILEDLRLQNITLQYAMIIFTTLPVIFVYPFFQKSFVKGVMIGSLKG